MQRKKLEVQSIIRLYLQALGGLVSDKRLYVFHRLQLQTNDYNNIALYILSRSSSANIYHGENLITYHDVFTAKIFFLNSENTSVGTYKYSFTITQSKQSTLDSPVTDCANDKSNYFSDHVYQLELILYYIGTSDTIRNCINFIRKLDKYLFVSSKIFLKKRFYFCPIIKLFTQYIIYIVCYKI